MPRRPASIYGLEGIRSYHTPNLSPLRQPRLRLTIITDIFEIHVYPALFPRECIYQIPQQDTQQHSYPRFCSVFVLRFPSFHDYCMTFGVSFGTSTCLRRSRWFIATQDIYSLGAGLERLSPGDKQVLKKHSQDHSQQTWGPSMP